MKKSFPVLLALVCAALLACGARRPFIVRCPAPADKADERGIALGKAGERDHGGGLFSVVDAPAEIILTVLCKREQVRGEPLQPNILRHAVEQSFANTCKLSERIGEHRSVCCFRPVCRTRSPSPDRACRRLADTVLRLRRRRV